MLENLVIPEEENPLLRQSLESKTTFANDSDRELAAARYFAGEINSGRMSVEEAYNDYWSYEEDAELWCIQDSSDFEYRALLNDWKPILIKMSSILDSEKLQNLVDVVAESYHKITKEPIDHVIGSVIRKFSSRGATSPFSIDYEFTLDLITGNDILRQEVGKQQSELLTNNNRTILIEALATLEQVGWYDERIFQVRDDLLPEAIKIVGKINPDDPRILEFLDHPDIFVKTSAISALPASNKLNEKVVDLIDGSIGRGEGYLEGTLISQFMGPEKRQNSMILEKGLDYLARMGRFDILSYCLGTKYDELVLKTLGVYRKTKNYDAKIGDLLEHDYFRIRDQALKHHIDMEIYDDRILDMLDGESMTRKEVKENIGIFSDNIDKIVSTLRKKMEQRKKNAKDESLPLNSRYEYNYIRHYLEIFVKLDHFDESISELLTEKEDLLKELGASTLARLKHYDSGLIDLLYQDSISIRRTAAKALGNMGVYHDRIFELATGNKHSIDHVIAQTLVTTGCPKQKLEILLSNSERELRETGIKILAKNGDYSRIIEQMEKELKTYKRQIRKNRGEEIAPIQSYNISSGAREVLSTGIKVLGKNKFYDPIILKLYDMHKREVLEALANMGHYDKKILGSLDADKWDKIHGLETLEKLKHYDEKVLGLLNDTDQEVRLKAVRVLGECGHYDNRILQLLKDEDLEVYGASLDALEKMQYYGKDLLELIGGKDKKLKRSAIAVINRIIQDSDDYKLNRKLLKEVHRRIGTDTELIHFRISTYDKIRPKGYNPPVKKLDS